LGLYELAAHGARHWKERLWQRSLRELAIDSRRRRLALACRIQ
jgi:hypothetical protein